MFERMPMPMKQRSSPAGKKSPPSRNPGASTSPAMRSPSFSKQKRITFTSPFRCALRRLPMTMPRLVTICWSRVKTRFVSGEKEYSAEKPVSRYDSTMVTFGRVSTMSMSWSAATLSRTERLYWSLTA